MLLRWGRRPSRVPYILLVGSYTVSSRWYQVGAARISSLLRMRVSRAILLQPSSLITCHRRIKEISCRWGCTEIHLPELQRSVYVASVFGRCNWRRRKWFWERVFSDPSRDLEEENPELWSLVVSWWHGGLCHHGLQERGCGQDFKTQLPPLKVGSMQNQWMKSFVGVHTSSIRYTQVHKHSSWNSFSR